MKFTQLFAAMAVAAVVASPAFAIEVKKSVHVDASPADTWAAIGDFCGIANWHPAIAKCEIFQQNKSIMRNLSLNGGGTIIEKQLAWNNAKMSYSYAITESPLPVENYKSTISVKKSKGGSTIVWSGSFKAKGAPDDKAKEVITGVYDGGLASLQKKLAK